jgi:hypothetical protein
LTKTVSEGLGQARESFYSPKAEPSLSGGVRSGSNCLDLSYVGRNDQRDGETLTCHHKVRHSAVRPIDIGQEAAVLIALFDIIEEPSFGVYRKDRFEERLGGATKWALIVLRRVN